jgi:hypothetical protein
MAALTSSASLCFGFVQEALAPGLLGGSGQGGITLSASGVGVGCGTGVGVGTGAG